MAGERFYSGGLVVEVSKENPRTMQVMVRVSAWRGDTDHWVMHTFDAFYFDRNRQALIDGVVRELKERHGKREERR